MKHVRIKIFDITEDEKMDAFLSSLKRENLISVHTVSGAYTYFITIVYEE